MNETDKLKILKLDLELLNNSRDEYLTFLLDSAKEQIENTGIHLNDDVADCHLVIMYAAYLYRKRTLNENAMPRMLKYALHNRLVKEMAGKTNV